VRIWIVATVDLAGPQPTTLKTRMIAMTATKILFVLRIAFSFL
jgi:hypothetical protein